MSDEEKGMTLTQKARRFAELHHERKEHKTKARELKKELDKIEADLKDELVSEGVQNLTVQPDGVPFGYTLYVHTQQYASPKVSKAEAVKVLQEHGYDDLVSPSHGKVSALFRDEEKRKGLPPELEEAFEVTEKVSVRARKK